jgi:hypothetical protein
MADATDAPLNTAELKELAQHKKWFAQLRGFLCVACRNPRKKQEFGAYGVFRPKKEYTKVVLPVTYILCKECKDLPADKIYDKVESWLIDHNHLVL